MKNAKKSIISIVPFICMAVVVVLLFLPWAHSPILEREGGAGVQSTFTLFSVRKMIEQANDVIDTTLDSGSLAPSAPALAVLAIAIILLIVLSAFLYVKKHKRAYLSVLLTFGAVCVLPILYLNTIFDANAGSAYSGPGLYTDLMSITIVPYITLFLGIFCAVVTVSIVSDMVSGKYDERQEARLELNRRLSASGGRVKGGFKNLLIMLVRDRHLYLMLLPVLLYYIVFYYLPYRGLQMAFMNYKPLLGYEGSNWIGFDTFQKFFTGPYFWRILRNTLTLSLYSLLWGFPIPIILALMFNELRSKRFRTMSQTISYIPNFISAVVIAGLVINFLSPSAGIINVIIGWFGVEPIYFITKSEYFRSIYVIQGIWSGAGFGSIIYYSSICSIDAELYEAATIDGAGRFKQILYITLPCLTSTIAIMLIMSIGDLMNTYTEMILLLYKPATYDVSDVIGTYVYRQGMINANPDYSLSTAVGLFNGIIAFVLVTSANKVSKKMAEVSIY